MGWHLLDETDRSVAWVEAIFRRARAYQRAFAEKRNAAAGRRAWAVAAAPWTGAAVSAAAGRTVALAFFEPSTRTRLSFELAARRLGADVLDLDVRRSSVVKGEEERETLLTLEALGAEVIVVRTARDDLRPDAGRLTRATVVAGGSGMHAHPTQALLDAYTLLEAFGRLDGSGPLRLSGLTVALVGDVRHSRVAASLLRLLPRLGARVVVAGPPTLVRRDDGLVPEAAVVPSVEAAVEMADAVVLLRLQKERLSPQDVAALGGDVDVFLATYLDRYGLDARKARRLRPGAVVLHPGPVWPDVEIARALLDDPRVLVRRQVENGVFVRMAVLADALGLSEDEKTGAAATPGAFAAFGEAPGDAKAAGTAPGGIMAAGDAPGEPEAVGGTDASAEGEGEAGAAVDRERAPLYP
ncbi:MAG: aspartate carbamoyltransferase catalytic subunit [Hydrogenibacillus schlegelii]|uniref:Aspartate carbamoyltransferase n=1 Tax=Hydrogenibacillus schlegelii TaxID=1484 RepID=A0A2T5GF15_HYDSH|nr:aspartate carbamoyltransferase catalytic subunit [Hydrogenibacillus schlegelii]MBT9281521.1 aspartate carbamoyltransferase catalytic subunit [Hydrogenibacillus schlegelii]PTQ54755.1 MAG: Aspartate carbamoyltransferase [Hydrogenibacillus schlegelii]